MSDYKPLGDVCGAVRWLASECVLNKTAVTCGFDALWSAIPPGMDIDPEQAVYFQKIYENPEMLAMMTGKAADGVELVNPGFWPTYEQERKAGNIVWTANPEENPWA